MTFNRSISAGPDVHSKGFTPFGGRRSDAWGVTSLRSSSTPPDAVASVLG